MIYYIYHIPIWKLKNVEFKYFFEKYIIKLKLSDESILRKNYVPLCYEDVLHKIRKEIGDSYTWVSIDEIITRSLCSKCNNWFSNFRKFNKTNSLNCRKLRKCNFSNNFEIIQ